MAVGSGGRERLVGSFEGGCWYGWKEKSMSCITRSTSAAWGRGGGGRGQHEGQKAALEAGVPGGLGCKREHV